MEVIEALCSSNPPPFSVEFHDSDFTSAFYRGNCESCFESSRIDSASDDSVGPSVAAAAVKLQKVYRSYRTRRRLAGTAVVTEELWWQVIDYARLNHSTISFFNLPETAASRWYRVSLNASKVGKGLFHDSRAQKLAFQHWIEAIDPRHRYGHNLQLYYDAWCKANSGQPFFYWLDIGDGKNLDLGECPRSKLRQQCVKYLGPQEREHYEYIVDEGMIIHKLTRDLLDTKQESEGAKWIFVMSTCKKLYAGKKKKGNFHHSSFLAGGATLAAGQLVVEHGILKTIAPYSGHYRPTDDRLDTFLSFLMENGVDLDKVQLQRSDGGYSSYEDNKSSKDLTKKTKVLSDSETPHCRNFVEAEERMTQEEVGVFKQVELGNEYKRTLSGGLQSPRTVVPKEPYSKESIRRKKNVMN